MKHLPPARLYDLTLSMRGYTPQSNAWRAEAHYTTVLRGNIHENRERLRNFAFPHFQEVMRRHYGMYIPRGEIRGNFQAEQLALTPTRMLHVDVLETVYRGRQHYDRQVTSEDLPYPPSDEIDEGMTPEQEAETEWRLLRGHVPGYDFPRKTTILTKAPRKTKTSRMKMTSRKLPRIDTLMLDKDCVVSSKWLRDYVRTVIIPVCRSHGEKVVSVKYNLSQRKGFHLRIHITPSVNAELANRLQFLLGDDAARVSKNRARIRVGLPNWDKLFAEENGTIRTIYRASRSCRTKKGTRRGP